jgi:hypothetical protein
MDTTGALPDSLQGKDLEPFRWTVNAGWGGEPQGCDFEVVYLGFVAIYDGRLNLRNEFYNSIKNVGSFNIKANTNKCPKEYFNKERREEVKIDCIWKKEFRGGKGLELKCRLEKKGTIAYCLSRPITDTIDLPIHFRYLKDVQFE